MYSLFYIYGLSTATTKQRAHSCLATQEDTCYWGSASVAKESEVAKMTNRINGSAHTHENTYMWNNIYDYVHGMKHGKI